MNHWPPFESLNPMEPLASIWIFAPKWTTGLHLNLWTLWNLWPPFESLNPMEPLTFTWIFAPKWTTGLYLNLCTHLNLLYCMASIWIFAHSWTSDLHLNLCTQITSGQHLNLCTQFSLYSSYNWNLYCIIYPFSAFLSIFIPFYLTYLQCPQLCCFSYRRRIYIEAKAKVVESVWGGEFFSFLAVLAIFPRSIWKNRLNSSYSIPDFHTFLLDLSAMSLFQLFIETHV